MVNEKSDPDVSSYHGNLNVMRQNVQDDPTVTVRHIPQERNPHENYSFNMS
jgi:hypothetical protein